MSINSGIFTILLQAGVLSAEDVEAVRAMMLKDETSVVSTITALRPDISALKIIQTISQFYGLPVLDIAAYNLDFMPKDILPINFIIKHKILPLSSHDKRLKLAVVDPTTKELFESITFRTGLALDLILVDEAHLKIVIDQNSSN